MSTGPNTERSRCQYSDLKNSTCCLYWVLNSYYNPNKVRMDRWGTSCRVPPHGSACDRRRRPVSRVWHEQREGEGHARESHGPAHRPHARTATRTGLGTQVPRLPPPAPGQRRGRLQGLHGGRRRRGRTRGALARRHSGERFGPVNVRLVRRGTGGDGFSPATTLLDTDDVSASDPGDLYHGSWGIGELYRIPRQTIAVDGFHGRTGRGVRRELYAHFNLVAMTRLFAGDGDGLLADIHGEGKEHQTVNPGTRSPPWPSASGSYRVRRSGRSPGP